MFIVAEIGLNHDGNFDLAYELIRQAKLAGADAAKFQFGWRGKKSELNHIDVDRASQLKTWCDYVGIEMFASIFTLEAWDLAQHIDMARYKIASRTVVDNLELCEKVLAAGKPTYISLGMWEKDSFPLGEPDGKNLHYIYCSAKYPTSPQDLVGMPKRFQRHSYYGYSDHLQGIEACLLAIARGARYIEKHLTLNKTSGVIRDHVLSANPVEFQQLVELGKPLARLVDVVGGQ